MRIKKIAVLLAICCLITPSIWGQQQPNPNTPEITFDNTVFDFGTIPFNGVAEREFTFTNTGNSPLLIQNCVASCGCTVPTCPKEPVKPGEKGTIKVQYTTTNVLGGFTKDFTVVSNAKNASVRITIKGEISNSDKN